VLQVLFAVSTGFPVLLLLATLSLQNLMDHSKVGVVQFVTQPLEEEEGA
jgi:hypothetical protein